MAQETAFPLTETGPEGPKPSNVKRSRRYERFGDTIRYLTFQELQRFLDCVDDYRHKLMMQLIYELGCRVGEFVRIQLKHLDFSRSTVLLPEENTKTKHRRFSWVPPGLMNEVKSLLKPAKPRPWLISSAGTESGLQGC